MITALIIALGFITGGWIVSQALSDAIAALSAKLDELIAKANTPAPVQDDTAAVDAVNTLTAKVDAALNG